MVVTLIGIGGIGSHFADWLAQFLAYQSPGATLTLVDGDVFEARNRERQAFDRPGNKAQVKAAELARQYPEITVNAVSEFLTPDNADFIIPDGEVVLVAVDNHATRKLLADVAAQRQELSIISAGNELTWGSVHIHLRRGGKDVTPPLTFDHPEIAEPHDRRPDELNCEERAAAGEPQLLVTNLWAGVVMLSAFWRLVTDSEGFVSKVRGEGVISVETAYTEVYFDVFQNCARGRRHVVPASVESTRMTPADGKEAAA